jgi:hypothetical protein
VAVGAVSVAAAVAAALATSLFCVHSSREQILLQYAVSPAAPRCSRRFKNNNFHTAAAAAGVQVVPVHVGRSKYPTSAAAWYVDTAAASTAAQHKH